MKLPIPKEKLLCLLDDLSAAVEEILLTGLTAASDSTRQTLSVAFQEASRMRLLRLGSTLRVASEEIGRFARNDDDFSPKRFSFFLNRAWMLSRGMAHAIRNDDEEQWSALTWNPAGKPVDALDVVAVGVSKRVVPGAFCAFEFRLRTVADSTELAAGSKLLWSAIFPMRPGTEVPPEGYLCLPQKQKFKAGDFLENKVLHLERIALVGDEGTRRVTMVDNSTVALGEHFDDWQRFQNWDQAPCLERLIAHEPGPFELDVELQEELVLTDWTIGEPLDRDRDRVLLYPVEADGIRFWAQVSSNDDGVLRARIEKLRKQKARPPLFGLMHVEMCKLVLQPLTVFGKDGPEHLGLSKEKVDAATLLRSMKF